MDQNNKTSDVRFEEDKWKQSIPSFNDETPGIIRLVMKYSGGLVKTRQQAEYILLGFVVVAIVVSLFLFLKGGVNSPQSGEVPAGQIVPG